VNKGTSLYYDLLGQRSKNCVQQEEIEKTMAWRVGITRHFIFFSLKKIQFINNLVSLLLCFRKGKRNHGRKDGWSVVWEGMVFRRFWRSVLIDCQRSFFFPSVGRNTRNTRIRSKRSQDREQMARKFPRKSSKEIRKLLNFRNANHATEKFRNFREKNKMERKFPVRKVGKFDHTSWGCTLLVIQENGVPIVTDNFWMEWRSF